MSAVREESLVRAWWQDPPGLLTLTSVGLVVSGLFAWFLAVSDQLLPHDLAWLEVAEHDLRAAADGRLVHFMAHDRAAFGGTIVAIGVLYLWLIRFPLRSGMAWAWWTLALTGLLGFSTFLTYLLTGYLDTWHGLATLAILPPFLLGTWQTRGLRGGAGTPSQDRARLRPDRHTAGRALILLTGVGMLVAGGTILAIGWAVVFVPQDLDYLGLDRAALDALDHHLVPLIAHDRIGFGGGLATVGCVIIACALMQPITRSLWEALLLAGLAGFGAALGVHVMIDYLDVVHLAPAVMGAAIFAIGMVLCAPVTARRAAGALSR